MNFLTALRSVLTVRHPNSDTSDSLHTRLEAIKARHADFAPVQPKVVSKQSPAERLRAIQERHNGPVASPAPLHGFAQAAAMASSAGELLGRQDRIGAFDNNICAPLYPPASRPLSSVRKSNDLFDWDSKINPASGLPIMGPIDVIDNSFSTPDF